MQNYHQKNKGWGGSRRYNNNENGDEEYKEYKSIGRSRGGDNRI